MISDKSQIPDELSRLIKIEVDMYCDKNKISHIPVKYGQVTKGKGANFDIRSPSLILSPTLSKQLKRHLPLQRVWYMLHLLGHEMKHYDQYIRLKKTGKPIRKEDFSEEEAYLAGYQFADDTIKRYTQDEINPKGGKRQRNPKGLYQAFHGSPPSNVKKVKVPNVKRAIKIGRLSALQYDPEPPSNLTGKRYLHDFGDYGYKFSGKNKPILAVSQDGKQLLILRDKSDFVFNERGIVG